MLNKCIPKTPFDIHKALCSKDTLQRSKYELLGPFGLYRNNIYEMYQQKCKEFKIKGEVIRNANVKALTNTKPKLGAKYITLVNKDDFVEEKRPGQNAIDRIGSLVNNFLNDDIRYTGQVVRKRHEKNLNILARNDKNCYFEPWFRRYLIMCQFINVVRKIILKNRMLKRLEILRKLTKETVEQYEEPLKSSSLSYIDLFAKFHD